MLMNVSAKFVKLLIIETPFLLPTAVFVFTLIFVWCIYRDLSEEMQLLRTNEAPELVNVPLVRQQRINEDGTLSLTTAGSDTSDTSSASTSQTEQSTIVNPDNAACARQLAVDEPTSAAFGASNTSYASTSEIEKSAVGNPDHVARVRQLAIDEDEALPPTTAGSGTSDTSGMSTSQTGKSTIVLRRVKFVFIRKIVFKRLPGRACNVDKGQQTQTDSTQLT